MRKFRRFYTQDQLAEIYAHAYDSTRWPEHVERIKQTIAYGQRLIDTHSLKTCADFSAGDRSVTGGFHNLEQLETSDGHILEDLAGMSEPVDLFVCTETIEHLEAPWTVLEAIAEKTKWLILSTPLDEDPGIGNHEHYWSFDDVDINWLLAQSGFEDRRMVLIGGEGWTYTYQLWTARSSHV
jgi:hypothetical protein